MSNTIARLKERLNGIRLDRACRDLNRLLDKAKQAGATLLEIAFLMPPFANGFGSSQALVSDGSDRHCNGPASKRVLFFCSRAAASESRGLVATVDACEDFKSTSLDRGMTSKT